jgi:hypothetical protein
MQELSLEVLLPIINRVFTVNGILPKLTTFKSETFDTALDIISGKILFKIHATIYKKGKIELVVIYNINKDITQPNSFTKIIIEKIQGSNQNTCCILEQIINMGNELPVTMIVIDDITMIKSKSRKYIDLLMILYTNQSVYSNMGFIQLTYPQLLTDLQLLLYTPINELKLPQELTNDILNLFGISPTENLNTLFFIMYPKYINKTYNTKELLLANNLYLFLINQNKNVKLYTQTTIYVSPHIPTPSPQLYVILGKAQEPVIGNILQIFKEPHRSKRKAYIHNKTKKS